MFRIRRSPADGATRSQSLSSISIRRSGNQITDDRQAHLQDVWPRDRRLSGRQTAALNRLRNSSAIFFEGLGWALNTALIVRYFDELPSMRDGEDRDRWKARVEKSLREFQRKATARYNEGTLLRLLRSGDARDRQAAVLALGFLGSMKANQAIARLLKDRDETVRHLAAQTLRLLWFRADSDINTRELQRILRLANPVEALTSLDALIKKSSRFAEAINQRAILFFRLAEYHKSIADCQRVLQLNPFHFGAQAGMAQCYLKLNKHRAALKAFRTALRIRPDLDGVDQIVRSLEELLGEEGRKDERK